MTEAQIASCIDTFHLATIQSTTYPYSPYSDPNWTNHGMLTPPLFPDTMDFDDSGRDDLLMYEPLSEPAQECEYLGVSKLQFARSSHPTYRHIIEILTSTRTGRRLAQHRPLRSASERNYATPTSESPNLSCSKDESMDKTKNNPRNDPRYDSKADKDGYYHCPFAHEGTCSHKPTKQKCIYA